MAPNKDKNEPSSFVWESERRDETSKEKMIRKAKENPFVPIGRLSSDSFRNLICCQCATVHVIA